MQRSFLQKNSATAVVWRAHKGNDICVEICIEYIFQVQDISCSTKLTLALSSLFVLCCCLSDVLATWRSEDCCGCGWSYYRRHNSCPPDLPSSHCILRQDFIMLKFFIEGTSTASSNWIPMFLVLLKRFLKRLLSTFQWFLWWLCFLSHWSRLFP